MNEEITPKWAREVLAKSPAWQPLDNKTVFTYVESLRDGQWRLTGAPINISDEDE